jgi:hypothetical protein
MGKNEISAGIAGTSFEWKDPSADEDENGIVELHLRPPIGVVVLD